MGGKRERPGLLQRLREVPHLFAKCIIVHCIVCGTLACWYALRILSRTGQDPAGLLGVILAFFGGELLLLCLRTVLKEKPSKDQGVTPGPPHGRYRRGPSRRKATRSGTRTAT